MLVAPLFFIVGVILLEADAAPNLPRALARLNEARARAITSRARVRANTARAKNQLASGRSKRQFEILLLDPPDIEEQNLRDASNEKEPLLLHVCPVSEEDMREADEASGEVEDAIVGEEEQLRDADAHLHTHSHIHQHSTTHGLAGHLPQTQLVVPGLNLNINQNQAATTLLNHPSGSLVHHQNSYLQHPITSVPIQTNLYQGGISPHGLRKSDDQAHLADAPPPSLNFHIPRQNSRFIQDLERINEAWRESVHHLQSHVPPLNPDVQMKPTSEISDLHTERMPEFDPFDEKDDVMDFLSRHPFRETLPMHFQRDDLSRSSASPSWNLLKQSAQMRETENNESDESEKLNRDDLRSADPTLHKKKQQIILIPIQPSYGRPQYNRYRQSDDNSREADAYDNEENLREASPTFKKKKKTEYIPIFIQPYGEPMYQSYGYRAAESEDAAEENSRDNTNLDDDLREASPTFKKKKKQPQYIPIYQQPYGRPMYQSYGYRAAETEDVAEENSRDNTNLDDDLREASPTFKKKKKQPQYIPIYQQPYGRPMYQSYGNYYRTVDDLDGIDDDLRDADPTLHKRKKPKHHTYRVTEDPESDDKDSLFGSGEAELRSPYLFNFPQNSQMDFLPNKFKRQSDLEKILGEERQIVDDIKHKSNDDDNLKLISHIGDSILTDLETKRKNITKRSIPLTRLISDPNVKLDVPKTIENFGVATKTAFEDEQAPMYHLNHMVGSTKNALLSALKIPPQHLIVPSHYEIVDKRDNQVGTASPTSRSRFDDDSDESEDDPLRFSHTFKRVGEMVRDSVKSSQDTAAHIGDIAHDARNILHTARHSAPRLIVPYSQIPALKDTRHRTPSKAVLITPRLLDLAEERLGKKAPDSRSDFVRLGHLMDAVGISKPSARQLELQKIILEPRRPRVSPRLAHLYNQVRDNYDNNIETVGDAVSTLEDARISVGAQNLRDFLIKMRNELSAIFNNSPETYKTKKHKKAKKKQQELGKFVETLFDGSHELKDDDTVGAGLYLPPELMHPFMNRASDKDLRQFLRDNNDEDVREKVNPRVSLSLDDQTLGDFIDYMKTKDKPKTHYEDLKQVSHENGHHNSDLGYVLGAINPLMFERMYNQTLKINNNNPENPHSMFQRPLQEVHHPEGQNDTVGTIMTLNGPMLKPFMGQAREQALENLLDSYNNEGEDEFINEEA